MTTQTFRIYPTQESFESQSPDWKEITGQISFEKTALISNDGQEYRLHLSKFAINDPWADMDMNAPVSKVTWLIPKDDHIWYSGSLSDGLQTHAYKENDQWFAMYKGQITPVDQFEPEANKRSFKRCLKITRNNGAEAVFTVYVWESPKYFYQQVAEKKIRFTKLSNDLSQKPVAFIDDENQEDVIGYIYPAP